ncbi:MAG: DNA primase [Clostridia bacterium]|nr:DNA primase [Clostridia bacterium]
MKEYDFKDFIAQLRSRCDIVSVISRYCTVSKRGRNFWACCPFHMERDASFCIYDEEQVFYCYGCKEHGDVIKFIMKIESCDYMQAVEILAKSVGMDVPNFSIKTKDGVEKKKKDKDDVLSVLREANTHYQQNLYTDIAKPAQEYIKKRKLTKRILDDFQIGYSIDSNEIISYLKSKGFSISIMEKAGLIQKSDHGYYDFFSRRIMFPLFNIYGECIGFSGRVINSDVGRAKYKNSPNTIVFDKSSTMFGLNLVRKLKQTNKVDNVIIVEGQMDVIAMHKAGFKNTVACLGTSFSVQHARMLRQISENVIVCLDGDNAGLKAANRITDIMAAEHLNVKCVLIPNNQDPDEYINEYGAEKMQEVLDNALDYIDFQINYLAKDVDFAKTDQKAKFVKNALKLLEKLSTNSERQVYLKHIKDLSGVPLDILQRDMLDLPLNKGKEDDTSFNERYEVEDASNKAIKFILASMLQKKDYAYKYDISNFLRNNSYIRLYSLLNTKREKGEDLKIAMLFDEFDMDNEPNIVDIIEYNFEQNGNNEKYYEECLWTLKEKDLKEKQAKLNEEYNNSSSLDRRREILMELNDISKKLKTKSLED